MGDIFAVATAHITKLFNNDQIDFFRLDIPAEAELADHDTGPRVLITLTELSGQRLADHSEFQVPANQVMYLDNTCSPGFRNKAGDLSYLVVSLNNHQLKQIATQTNHDHTVLNSDLVTVNHYAANQQVNMPWPGLLYRHTDQLVVVFDADQDVTVEADDWVIYLQPALFESG